LLENMKLSSTQVAIAVAMATCSGVNAFAPRFGVASTTTSLNGIAKELGLPCDDECALEAYPSLPESVHPGVLSGQSLLDLIEHARDNGKASI
jgi:fructose-bisphosphate aldolase class II